jgi:hypothetical protein
MSGYFCRLLEDGAWVTWDKTSAIVVEVAGASATNVGLIVEEI